MYCTDYRFVRLVLCMFSLTLILCTLQDCELLNLGDRPEKLIVTEIAVPPVPIRPSVFVAGGRMRFALQFFSTYMSNGDSA